MFYAQRFPICRGGAGRTVELEDGGIEVEMLPVAGQRGSLGTKDLSPCRLRIG
jgi:hypothetical protein